MTGLAPRFLAIVGAAVFSLLPADVLSEHARPVLSEAATANAAKQDRLGTDLDVAIDAGSLTQPMPPPLPDGDAPASNETQPEAVAASPISPEEDNAGKLQFDAFINGLFEFQDAIVAGDSTALALQGKVLRRLQMNLQSEWRMFETPDAPIEPVLIFALSGGDARVSVDLLNRIPANHPASLLVRSVTGYLKGNPDSAQDLATLDPTEYEFPLGALVSLATGTANARSDTKAAERALQMASILGSGTLVEEVALRRLLDLYALDGRQEDFFAIAESYGMRFHQSMFLNEFARRVSDTLSERGWVPPRGMSGMLEYMDRSHSVAISQQVARAASIKGHHELARMAIAWWRRFEPSGADDQLYEAMADLAAQDIAKAAEVEAGIDDSALSDRDRPLLASLRRALAHITRKEPETPVLTDGGPPRLQRSLLADMKPDRAGGSDDLSIGIADTAPQAAQRNAQSDTELATLRERLNSTLAAIEELGAD